MKEANQHDSLPLDKESVGCTRAKQGAQGRAVNVHRVVTHKKQLEQSSNKASWQVPLPLL